MYKKVLSILLSVLLLFSILPMSSAYNVGKTASLTIETVEVPEGHKDQIDVKFTLENAQKLKSFSLTNLTFDSSKLEFVSGRCENKSATMSQVLSNGNAVVAFTDNTDINGVILVYTFALAEGVIADEIEISATFSAKTKPAGGVETNVEGIELIPGKIIVKSEAPNAPDSIDNFEYELTNEGIVITGYTGTKANVVIAESYEIDGTSYDVVEIAMEAFLGQEAISSVTIPETVKKIGEAAFYDCTSLTEVTVLSKDAVIDAVALGYYYASRKEHIVEGFTIYGYEGSTAETYATENEGITFVVLEEEAEECPHNGGIANCQEQAVCDLCGKGYGDIDKNNHKTVVIDEAVAPDCENTGLTEGSHCSACNTVIVAQETVDRLGHDFTVFVETVDYTCDKDGYDVYKCSRCDATENKNFTDAACRPESDYTVIEKASCDKTGYKAILCSICKEELETETIVKREHNIVDTTVATKATCITEGVMNQKCDCVENEEYEACAYTTTRAIPVDAENHEGEANVIKNAKDATCYSEGYTGDTYWSCCDVLYAKGEATDKIAHTPAEAVRENEVAATCYKAGSYDEVVYCSVEACKHEISREEKTIEKISHTPAKSVEENRIEATCAVDGSYDEVVYCSVVECKAQISRETKIIPATGEHNYATEVEGSRVPSTCKTAGKVTMKCGCGATKDVALEIDATNHEKVVTDAAVAPDCENTGLTEGSHCSACDTVIVAQQTVDKLGHDFTVFVETVDYTCDKDGYDVYKCSRCDVTENRNFTDAACRPEADYTVIEKASCYKAGYKAILCSVCKKELETETIAKREHNIVDTTVAIDATCITEGVMNQKCDRAETEEYEACTYTTTRAIPVDAENHEGEANVIKNAKDATCYAEGYTGDTYWSCCDVLYLKGKATEKIAHTPADAVRENEVAATCYKVGSYDEVVYCSVEDCKHEISRESKTIEKTAHTPAVSVRENEVAATCYKSGSYDEVVYCSVEDCKYEISRTEKIIEKTAHTPAEAVEENRIEATCAVDGSYDEVVYCSVKECKLEISRETKTIEKTAHTPAVSVRENEVAATCYKSGSYDEVVYCSVEDCKYEISRTEKIIEKTAHTPAEAVEENRIEATCAIDGSYDEVVYCSVKECKLEISRETRTIFATGEHNYATEVEDSRVPSTCKTVGKVTMKCGCGATKEVTLELDATNHETVVADNAVAPDCENTGLTEGSHCSACDTVIIAQQTVDKLGHDFKVFVETIDYTCDKDGYDIYKCSRCEATENKNFTDAACRPEAYYTVIEKASCDKAGYKAILCSVCKEELETETIAKREHNIVDTTVATKATCLIEGVMNQKCDCAASDEYVACTYTTTRAIPVDVNNHEGTANIVKNAKDATCYAEGYTGDTYWSCCDVLYAKGKATDKIAHTPADAVEESRTESTCKVAGNYDSVVYCSVCDEELSREIIDLPLADHTEAAAVEENRTDSTCKVAGSYDSVVYCSVCDEELSRDAIDLPIDPTNHSGKTEIRNAVTGNCGEVGYTGDVYCLDCNTKIADGKEIPANENHNYVGEETKAATCKATGVMTYTCSVCGDSYTEVIPVNIDNHTSSKTVIRNSVEATCVTEGYSGDEYYECCGAAKAAGSVIPINADNHKNIVIDKAVNATCKESGLTEGSHCESCGTVIIEQIVIEKARHIESTIPEVAPDCINDGLTEGIECLICGEILVPQESVAALGHIFTVVSAVYDENNVGTVVYECIDCGYEKTEEVAFDLADAFELIDEAEKKLSSDELTQDEREKIEASLAEFEAFIETYVVFDEEGNIIENNLPLNDSDVMTQYNKLLVNLDNAINGREASEGSASWGDIISRLIDLIIMLLDLVYKLVVYLKAN